MFGKLRYPERAGRAEIGGCVSYLLRWQLSNSNDADDDNTTTTHLCPAQPSPQIDGLD